MASKVEHGREKGDGVAQASHPFAPKLNSEQQRQLVTMLARFSKTKEIQAFFIENHGIELSRHAIAGYDASKVYCRASRKLQALFHAARQRYLTDFSDVGIAHIPHRLRMLERMAERAEDEGQSGMASKLLEQAAREMGGGFTNVQQVKHSGGMSMVHLTAEDAKAELAQRLGQAVQQQLALPCPVRVAEED